MKKIIFLAISMCMFLLTGCTKQSPSSVVEKFIVSMKEDKYVEAMEMMQFSESVSDEEKEEWTGLMETKMSESLAEKGGIESYEIVSEEIFDDGKAAHVVYSIVYGNGETGEETVSLVKQEDKWLIESGK
ncbi:MAG: DUF4878 domain-containing protein [Bacteroidaceae bacterium]|nr:DUF4878 domain-containing protein [Bacteroidaceae bacterium]